MGIDNLKLGNLYMLKDEAPYTYSKSKNESIFIVDYGNCYRSYDGKLLEVLKEPFLKGSLYCNVKLETSGVIIYTNSYYLVELGGGVSITNFYIDVDDDFFDNNDELDCVEIKNGQAKFNKSLTKEQIERRFQEARFIEENLGFEQNIKGNWDKELIHMGIDTALENGDKEEFMRLTNKLKEIK